MREGSWRGGGRLRAGRGAQESPGTWGLNSQVAALVWGGAQGVTRAWALDGCTPGCQRHDPPSLTQGTTKYFSAWKQWWQETPNLAWAPAAWATANSLAGLVLVLWLQVCDGHSPQRGWGEEKGLERGWDPTSPHSNYGSGATSPAQ